MKKRFVPTTPAGTLIFELEARTEKRAIKKLLRQASHMPYQGWEGFKQRGYTIKEIEE